MKVMIIFFIITAMPVFATVLRLSSVKQVVYLHGSDTDVKMTIIDVPFATAYADPEWRFSAISKPFIPAGDGSWRDPSDINLASLYGIAVTGTYKGNSKDMEVIINAAKAKVPEGYPFTLDQVLEQVKKCVHLMYPHDLERDGKLEIRILKVQSGP